MEESNRGNSTGRRKGMRQRRMGEVVSAKMAKTVVVRVSRQVAHPKYKRVIRMAKKFYAHDEQGQCREGDRVEIEETRPLSKLKRWRVVRVVQKARA
ncbi:MAG TPA: 30S ribosomal protein S17 [Candidatus Xenobia bacterium]|nr:30S ribosomal protein S17 [Candidatus Xenobia bacterium]